MARKDEDTFEAGTDRETERLPGKAVERREPKAKEPAAREPNTAEYPEVAGKWSHHVVKPLTHQNHGRA